MRTIRWGIVGCGDVCEVKSGPGFQKARGSELVAVMRRDGAKAADFAKRHGVARWYDDADALIHDKDVDAVYVATPPGTHELFAMKACAAGKPCYVEKPMARNASEARRMVEGFKKAGVPLFVAYYRRAMPRFLKVKEILESGVLGDLFALEYYFRNDECLHRKNPIPWRLNAEDAGGGLFLDLGSHAIDLMDYFFGPFVGSKGIARNIFQQYEIEDYVTVSFDTDFEKRGVMEWSFCDDEKKTDRFLIAGHRGALHFSCFGAEPIHLKFADGRREVFDLGKPEHVHQPLVQTIVDELLGAGKSLSTGENGLRCQEVMDAAITQYYGGREDGFWKREWPGNRR